jgi:hypothetical protein
MMNSTSSDRLRNIVVRQRQTGLRDLMFVACVALATIVGVSSVGTSVAAASTHLAQK